VQVSTKDGKKIIQTEFLIDATGSKTKWSRHSPNEEEKRPGGFSLWSYYKDVERFPFPHINNTITARFDEGWFWIIPIRDNYVSVGVCVSENYMKNSHLNKNPEELFNLLVSRCPLIKNHLGNAKRVEKFRACFYKPRNLKKYYFNRQLCIGDAACFIDPVLSTGIHLGMTGACYAARAILTISEGGDEKEALNAFDRFYRNDYRELRELTDALISMNRYEPGAYWQDQITNPTAEILEKRSFREKQCEELSKLKGWRKQVELQNEHTVNLYKKFGTGRFRTRAFQNTIVTSLYQPGNIIHGYTKGDFSDNCFRACRLYRSNGSAFPVTEADEHILSSCLNPKKVIDIVYELIALFGIKGFSAGELSEKIGVWVDRGIIVQTSKINQDGKRV